MYAEDTPGEYKHWLFNKWILAVGFCIDSFDFLFQIMKKSVKNVINDR